MLLEARPDFIAFFDTVLPLPLRALTRAWFIVIEDAERVQTIAERWSGGVVMRFIQLAV